MYVYVVFLHGGSGGIAEHAHGHFDSWNAEKNRLNKLMKSAIVIVQLSSTGVTSICSHGQALQYSPIYSCKAASKISLTNPWTL